MIFKQCRSQPECQLPFFQVKKARDTLLIYKQHFFNHLYNNPTHPCTELFKSSEFNPFPNNKFFTLPY